MFGRKKMIPAGFAAMGILIAAMAFVGGCGTQNTDQNDQTKFRWKFQPGRRIHRQIPMLSAI